MHTDLERIKIVTDLGDAGVLLPLSVVLFVWLLAARTIRIGLIWLLIVVACNGLIGLLKLYFLACPIGALLKSPSGHTGFSLFIYGTLATIVVLQTQSAWRRAATIMLSTAFIGAIAGSRFMLGVHSLAEIALGAVVGGVSLAIFILFYRRLPDKRRWVWPLILMIVVSAIVFDGQRLRAEPYFRHLSASLDFGAGICEN